MEEERDKIYMKRCIDLAVKAEGNTYPNPMAGAIVVYNDIIAGEGYHLESGMPHAEVIAINSVTDKSVLKKAILYVSLEPCPHYGKTAPCTDLIISSGIPRVVIGTNDTSDKVSGRGIDMLRKAGCEVVSGVLESECRRINRRFFTYHEKRRPYITLKWAESADGFMDIERPNDASVEPNWITGLSERVAVHKWRASEEAILVGGETIRKDAPKLNVRYWKGRDPLKIILSGSCNIGNYLSENKTKSLVFTYKYNKDLSSENAEQIVMKNKDIAAEKICDVLYQEEKQSLLIEGGAKVLEHFISLGLWDEARIFKGFRILHKGVKSPFIQGEEVGKLRFSSSELKLILNKNT
ncbi:MAG: bifunctional diaminohydroxyphosphoribosylaminopyrimidine deaminase/5-amino-6-(5-phosphoribosylamino)uracil reductase RibD [Bacteroidales bacterium]|nr:bifunctional diaminohydroxyphosphoribosylaminopyrimidine deaminase/5-amino-6-(5-phosphoribosylamino)uracil reductase RibD [Bacteroidales bacterium]